MEVHSVAQAGFRTGTNDLYNRWAAASIHVGEFPLSHTQERAHHTNLECLTISAKTSEVHRH